MFRSVASIFVCLNYRFLFLFLSLSVFLRLSVCLQLLYVNALPWNFVLFRLSSYHLYLWARNFYSLSLFLSLFLFLFLRQRYRGCPSDNEWRLSTVSFELLPTNTNISAGASFSDSFVASHSSQVQLEGNFTVSLSLQYSFLLYFLFFFFLVCFRSLLFSLQFTHFCDV